jgi:hypothetical protein
MTILRWKVFSLILLCMMVCIPAAMAREITMTPGGATTGAASLHENNYPISIDRAMLFVKDFVGDYTLDLELDDVEGLQIGNYYKFYADDDHFWVNQQSGDVEFAHFASHYKNSKMINLTHDQAYTAARAYAVAKYSGFSDDERKWALIEDKLINSSAGSEYAFVWREFIGSNGWWWWWDESYQEVTLPNIIHVSVNANNGKIIDYWGVDRRLSAPTKPEIDMVEALETAEESVPSDITVSHPKIRLTLGMRTQNVETLAYIVSFEGIRGKEKIPVTVYVDANSGRIIRDVIWVDDYLPVLEEGTS